MLGKSIVVVISLLATGCDFTSAEEAARNAGGKGLILCGDNPGDPFTYCKDDTDSVFVCKRQLPSKCLQLKTIILKTSNPQPEITP